MLLKALYFPALAVLWWKEHRTKQEVTRSAIFVLQVFVLILNLDTISDVRVWRCKVKSSRFSIS